MEINKDTIKKEILELFGEKVYYIFANNQGSPNESEFLEALSFQEVIALNSELYIKALSNLIDNYREENKPLIVDFLSSFEKFIKTFYNKNSKFTEMEESFGDTRYKELIKEKSIEIFKIKNKDFSEISLRKIMQSEELTEIFKNDFCQGEDLSKFSNKDLKSKLDLFSKANIINSLDKIYKSLRSKPLINAISLFNDSQLTEYIISDIQS